MEEKFCLIEKKKFFFSFILFFSFFFRNFLFRFFIFFIFFIFFFCFLLLSYFLFCYTTIITLRLLKLLCFTTNITLKVLNLLFSTTIITTKRTKTTIRINAKSIEFIKCIRWIYMWVKMWSRGPFPMRLPVMHLCSWLKIIIGVCVHVCYCFVFICANFVVSIRGYFVICNLSVVVVMYR